MFTLEPDMLGEDITEGGDVMKCRVAEGLSGCRSGRWDVVLAT